jgi:uroporphyrin-III C-methyltransferase
VTESDSPPTELSPTAEIPNPAPVAPVGTAPRPRLSWLSFFAFLFATLALVIVGWRTYRDQTERELADYHMSSVVGEQSLAIGDLRQRVADLRADDRSGRQQLAASIEQLRAQIEIQQQHIAALTSVDRSDWELAEAEYLLQLANQRLLLGGDTHAALELLTSADAIVRELDDSGLLPVRAALAKDIAALKAIPAVDIEGTYLAIAAASEQAAKLPLIRPPEVQPEVPVTADAPSTWQERLGAGLESALHKLDQLVQIRRRDEPYKPLLAPQYEAALRQNLKLMFEQAQSALLAGNQQLYVSSLDKAQFWLTTYFTLDETAAHGVVATIDELKAREIKPELPDASTARRALNVFIKSRRALQDDNGSNPATANPSTGKTS